MSVERAPSVAIAPVSVPASPVGIETNLTAKFGPKLGVTTLNFNPEKYISIQEIVPKAAKPALDAGEVLVEAEAILFKARQPKVEAKVIEKEAQTIKAQSLLMLVAAKTFFHLPWEMQTPHEVSLAVVTKPYVEAIQHHHVVSPQPELIYIQPRVEPLKAEVVHQHHYPIPEEPETEEKIEEIKLSHKVDKKTAKRR